MNRHRHPAVTSAALSALFLVVYLFCNWISSLRPHVPSLCFTWERAIPFVAAFIVPYMSVDLFFIAAPFLVKSDGERTTLIRRIVAAILIAGVCFLLFPLRLSFVRPHVDGFLGVIFNNFRSVDKPFNEFPSLHIALCIILAAAYIPHFKGASRLIVGIWFVLMGVSPLLTYQHHVVDILGGVALAVFCLHFFDRQPIRQPFQPNRLVAGYYAAGGAILLLLSLTWKPWTLLLLWPATSLAIVAAGYLWLGPGIFRKKNGVVPWTTWVLLGPVLIGQRISLIFYSCRCRAYDRFTENVWIGRKLCASEARQACESGITAVVDLTAEFSEPACLRALPYLQVAILDLTPPTAEQIDQAVSFIRRHARHGIVYLHCKVGYSRTAAVAGASLMATRHFDDVGQVIAALCKARASIIIRPEALAALRNYHIHHQDPTTVPSLDAVRASGS